MLVCLSRNRKVPAYRKHEQLNSTRPADWLLVRVLVRRVVLVSVLIRERLVLRMAPLLDFVLKSTNTLALLRATWKEGQILSPAKVYPMHTSRKVSSETACGIPMSVPLFSPTPHDRLLPPSLASISAHRYSSPLFQQTAATAPPCAGIIVLLTDKLLIHISDCHERNRPSEVYQGRAPVLF